MGRNHGLPRKVSCRLLCNCSASPRVLAGGCPSQQQQRCDVAFLIQDFLLVLLPKMVLCRILLRILSFSLITKSTCCRFPYPSAQALGDSVSEMAMFSFPAACLPRQACVCVAATRSLSATPTPSVSSCALFSFSRSIFYVFFLHVKKGG